MKKIAWIVYDKELSNHEKRDWIYYFPYDEQAKGKLSSILEKDIPTLVVGWNLFKTEFQYLNPYILKQSGYAKKNLEWIFSLDEKLNDHFMGLDNFVKTVPKTFISQYPYRSIDPIKNGIVNSNHLVNELMTFIDFSCCRGYQYKEEMIYLLDYGKWEITGIYLNAFRYFMYDVNAIVREISHRIPETSYVHDSDGSIYQKYYKEFPQFDQLKRSIVLFL